jgi:Predicted Zn-dependent peptidases
MAGLFAISVQAPEALAGQLAEIAFYGLPDDYLKTYLTRIRAVTLTEINRVAKRYVTPDQLSLVVVGPGQKITPQLKGLGTFETLSVELVGKSDVEKLQGANAAPVSGNQGASNVDENTKQRIDKWIKEKGRNSYGDPKDTLYTGGTPLFDERTGKTKDKYEYILEKHPELRSK